MTHWPEVRKKYFMDTTKRLPVTLVRGEGARVWDDQGKRYLDFVAGWAVNSLGHCHPAVVKALTDQARTLIHASNQFYTVPQLQLAQILAENSSLNKSFFANSGAEAVEGAVKLARRWGKLHLNGAYQVITAVNSFHGRTLAMVAATGQRKFQEPYSPIPEGFINVDYNNIEAVTSATTDKVCAVMLEPIQGEGGVNVPDSEYFKKVRRWCDQKNILLILDEVQTGLGRTGTLWGYQQTGVEPDVMTLAKGLGSGVPIGAIMATDRASVFKPGDHGSTFGGNPLVCAAAYATVNYIIEHEIPARATRVGRYLVNRLDAFRAKYDFITEVRGRGLLVALQFNKAISDKVVEVALNQGLLLNPVKPDAIRFMPPLIITEAEVDEAIDILDKVLAEVAGHA